MECDVCGDQAVEFCRECDKHYCNGCSSLVHQHPKRRGHTVSTSVPPEADPGEQEVEETEAGGQQEQGPDHGAHLSQQDKAEAQLLGLLVRHFQLPAFKPWQKESIQAVLEGKDSLVVQPTGSGKSICYQFPPVYTGKLSLVVTPTISLMLDQSASLIKKGLRATYLGSCQQDDSVYDKMASSAFDVVFLTPETLFDRTGSPKHFFQCLARKGLLGMIAVDEAHLIHTWKNFRDPFKHLPALKDHFKGIPLMALTATATPTVKDELLEMLRDPVCHVASVNKPNIYYRVEQLKTAEATTRSILSDANMKALRGKDCLNDEHIHAAQKILAKQFPDRAGFQYTLRYKSVEKPIVPQTNEGTIQLHNIGGDHWVTTIFSGGAVRLFDSLYAGVIADDLVEQITETYGKLKEHLTVQVVHVQQQQGCTECGLYAIAYAVDLCFQCNPSTVKFHQKDMRGHLIKCLEDGRFSRFPHDSRSCRAARPETVILS